MHYVYILRRDQKWYIGSTDDLSRRFREHSKQFSEIILVYYEAYQTATLAKKREKMLKYHGSGWRALQRRLQA